MCLKSVPFFFKTTGLEFGTLSPTLRWGLDFPLTGWTQQDRPCRNNRTGINCGHQILFHLLNDESASLQSHIAKSFQKPSFPSGACPPGILVLELETLEDSRIVIAWFTVRPIQPGTWPLSGGAWYSPPSVEHINSAVTQPQERLPFPKTPVSV